MHASKLLLCPQVTNHTNAKLVVSLAVPGWSDPIAAKDSSKSLQQVFTVRASACGCSGKQQWHWLVAVCMCMCEASTNKPPNSCPWCMLAVYLVYNKPHQKQLPGGFFVLA